MYWALPVRDPLEILDPTSELVDVSHQLVAKLHQQVLHFVLVHRSSYFQSLIQYNSIRRLVTTAADPKKTCNAFLVFFLMTILL